ncbi:telomerase component 1-like, partial [Brachionus plicatilis]
MSDLKPKLNLTNTRLNESLSSFPKVNLLLGESTLTSKNSYTSTSLSTNFRKTKLNLESPIDLKPNKLLKNESFQTKPTINNSLSTLSTVQGHSNKHLLKPNHLASSKITKLINVPVINLNTSSSLLSSKILSGLKTDPDQQSNPLKRQHEDKKSEEPSIFLEEEYLKTESMINLLNDEIKKMENNFLKAKRRKINRENFFFEDSMVIDGAQMVTSRNKNSLVNAVSSSLLREPNFKNQNDSTRNLILNLAKCVIQTDPEFVLKLALYTRKELNIRTTANFLLCLAANTEQCRPYMQRYFKHSIALPSDWIDVAEQYQLFSDKRINFGALPSALRKCMVEKFPDFDRYQLAKYNKDKSAKNKNLKDIKHVRSKLKDENGQPTNSIEHKYIKSVPSGLKTKDKIKILLTYTEQCDNIKIDIINREEKQMQRSQVNLKKGKKNSQEDESNDLVACRVIIDLRQSRLLAKNLKNKTWSTNNTIKDLDKSQISPAHIPLGLFVNMDSKSFQIGHVNKDAKEEILISYSHSKHGVSLSKLNIIRISGVGVKLNELNLIGNKVYFDDEESHEEVKQRTFTLKQLIRQLHISSPVDNVMCLLGKKYPMTFEEFMKLRLPGIFDSERAGKRMKLEIPETWETQISMHGNKAEVWEKLIDNKKLPYMAMLRNLRNMIKCGISQKHHQWVINKLQDEGAVIHSKQFPFRFFTAYEVLDELEEDYNNFLKPSVSSNKIPMKKKEIKKDAEIKYCPILLKRYKTALDNALKVATTFNVSPIQGSTVIILNLSRSMDVSAGNSARSLGKRVTSVSEMAALLALMFRYSCENSEIIIFANGSSYTNIQLEQGTILDNMKSLIELKNLPSSTENDTFPRKALLNLFDISQTYDNLIYLSNGIDEVEFVKEFLRKYRCDRNQNLMFVNVNLATSTVMLASDPNFDHENDINISGFSDAILRFVAERGNKGQLTHIENIDKAFDLPEPKKNPTTDQHQKDQKQIIEKPKLKIYVPKQEFKTIKVFISSTFRDFHSERDILSKTVFPLLRSKLSSLLINIYEIDLRWGITETEAESNQTLDLCLNQVLNSDYFINMLGARYGYVLDDYSVRQNSQLDWLSSYPPGASVTELEIETQMRKHQEQDLKYENAFFYFRDNSFIQNVPAEYRDHFVENNVQNSEKLESLKAEIRNSSYEIFDGYKCRWFKGEQFSNGASRALVCDLDSFAQRVFHNLFNSISKHHKYDASLIELDEINHYNNLTEAFMKLNSETFIGRDKLLKKFLQALVNQHKSVVKILVLNGQTGSGKTSLISHFFTTNEQIVHKFVHLVGAYPGSESLTLLLKRFSISTNRTYNLGIAEQDLESNNFDRYKILFETILNKLSEKISEKFYMVIDGVDFLVDDLKNVDRSFSWLPENVNLKIVFVFTARPENSISNVLAKISSGSRKIETMEIEDLDILDKSEFIKSKLAKYNKYLEETPFNNQIKMLTTKKDSANPLYLSLVCQELRTHNQFETLNQKLKEIPIRINQLLNYVLERLENDFDHDYVNMAFSFICLSRDGLNELELRSMITIYFKLKKNNLLELLNGSKSIFNLDRKFFECIKFTDNRENTASKFLSFLESINETFLKPRSKSDESSIRIRSNQYIENSLKLKYGNRSLKFSPNLVNKIMSLFYWSQIEENFDNKWSNISLNPRALVYLPFHLINCEMIDDLAVVAANFRVLEAKCELGLANEIMNDFDFHQEFATENFLSKNFGQNLKKISQYSTRRFDDYKKFIQSNYHLLASNPSLFYQQIMNEPNDSAVLQDLMVFVAQNSSRIRNLFQWINKEKQTDKFGIFPVTIKDFDDSASSVSISPDGNLVVCGTKNCQIKLYQTSTAKLIRNFRGHSGNITSVKFVGNDILCSTSSDGKACLWNVTDGYRIKVLDKHSGHVVRDSCSDSKGTVLITVGWDCGAKIWNTKTGMLDGELKGHTRPVNCVALNNDETMVATGSWDACIRIYNLYDRVRKAVLRGHKTSVRSIGYSFDGVYIASASIDGEVKLWNSKFGTQIGSLLGHSMPVNSISFSPTSKYLATASSDRRVKVWSGTIGKLVKVIDTELSYPLTSVSFYRKTGEYIAVGSHEGEILIYDILGKLILKIKVHKAFVTRIRFSNSGRYVMSTCNEGKLAITDISTDKGCVCAERYSSKSLNALTVNDCDVVITGGDECEIFVYPEILDQIKNKNRKDQSYSLKSHSSPITALSFNTTGDKFASSSKDSLIIIWNLNHIDFTASQLFSINNAHLDWITDLEWSNSADFILSSSNDNTLKIWNSETGKEKCVLKGHTSNINSCSFQYGCAVSTCFDGSVKIWSHKGHEISTLLGHQGKVNSCDLFFRVKQTEPINQELQTDESMDLGSIWGEQMEKETWLENHKKKVSNNSVAIDQVFLVSCSDDSTIRIWKPIESDYLLSLENYNDSVNSVLMDRNYLIATASADKSLNLWNTSKFFQVVQSGKMVKENGPSKTHCSEITSICFDKKCTILLSASFDGVVIMWKLVYSDVNGKKNLSNIEYVQELSAHDKSCNGICVINESENEVCFATCSLDQSIKVWQIDPKNYSKSIELVQILKKGLNKLFFIDILENGKNKYLISAEHDSKYLCIRKNKIKAKNIELSNDGIFVSHFRYIINNFSLHNNMLYLTTPHDEIFVFDLNSSKSFSMFNPKSDKSFYNLSSDAKPIRIDNKSSGSNTTWYCSLVRCEETLFVGDSVGNLFKNDGIRLTEVRKIHESKVTNLISFGEKRIMSSGKDGVIKVWNENCKIQLGQFTTNNCVTVLKKLPISSENLFAFGD